jgi:hypothetical protein
VNCTACGITLTPDAACPDTEYQFENALWICFHGGYAMFVDNLEATLPNNTDDRWLRNEDGTYITGTNDEGREIPIDNPNWQPTYIEPRTIYPPSDYEAVICHDCAHDLCHLVPWIEHLLIPYGSHSHRTAWKNAHPEHFGWDYNTAEQ